MNQIFRRFEPFLKTVMWLGVIASAIYIFNYHIAYISTAKSIVPIMDYWGWIAIFGERVHDGTITFWDYFDTAAGGHIHPFDLAVTFGVLKAHHFDVVPLVHAGLMLRIGTAVAFTLLFITTFLKKKVKSYSLLTLSSMAILLTVINHNQWEAMTEPFALSFSLRIILYSFSFYLAEKLISGIQIRSSKKNILFASGLGLYCACLTIFEGGAYFVGHLTGIGLGLLWVLLCRYKDRESFKKYFWPMSVWAGICFLSACIYLILIQGKGTNVEIAYSLFELPKLIIKGICYFWGSIFIHQQTTGPHCIRIGAIVLLYGICIVMQYLYIHRDGKGLFPAICFLYAFVLSVIICIGRAASFGPESMTSSRYVVESSLALFGIIWMTYGVFVDRNPNFIKWALSVLCVCLVILGLVKALRIESNIAPDRKLYNENLYTMMLNIDNYTDEELIPFQAGASSVRFCVDFFEKNNLSIFYENN